MARVVLASSPSASAGDEARVVLTATWPIANNNYEIVLCIISH